MSGAEQLARILAQEDTPPATGSGSRLGSAVVIVSGSFSLPKDHKCLADSLSCIRLYCHVHLPLLNLVTIEKLPQTHSAEICSANTPHVDLPKFLLLSV
jgi:hypothetical protein